MKYFIKRMVSVFAIIAVALFTTNCKKDNQTKPSDGTKEVYFTVNSVTENGLKSTNSDTIICSDKTADYVKYKLDGGPFKVIAVNPTSKPTTSSIKLPIGIHTLNEFLVYSDNNTPNDSTDDILLSATPHTNATFSQYITTPLDLSINITTDRKPEIIMDVVCFQPTYYSKFGFVYFQLNQIKVRQLWFFGDFCIKEKADYVGSQYTQQANWGTGTGFIDAPAIFKIETYHNGVLKETFSNSFQGEKLSVTYSDDLDVVDHNMVKLYILVRQGTSFIYKEFYTWTFDDVSNIPQGTDGVVDFVLGNCYDPLTPPDLILAPYMNIPPTATYKITGWNPAVLGGYVDAQLTNIPSGYEITNGTYASNCADHSTVIFVGTPYNMNVYSSLYPDALPLFAQSTKWAKINWLYNHLDYFSGYLWSDIQGAIWLFDNPVWDGQATAGMPPLTPMMTNMKAQMDLYGSNYRVPPGGWATIIFIPVGTSSNSPTPTIQTMFIKVDP